MSDLVVGIDLGTTNTCASYYINGRVKILENEEGGRITPSYVFITENNKVLIGHYAQRMANAKPEYVVYEVKRLIGRKFDDPYVQRNLQYFSFTVENDDNDIFVSIDQKGNKISKTPQELCTAILTKVKTDIQSKTGESVDKAVITVPAYFNVKQREATLAAANKAGFIVLKLLNEPTAAALSYHLENDTDTFKENHSLVYDLGGGTFDVAILKRNGSNIDIIAVDGDTHLGGHDFDNLIIDYVCEQLIRRYNYNPKNDRRTMRRLRNECEDAKKTLSLIEDTKIVLHGFVKDMVEIDLTRKEFEKMCCSLFDKTIKIIDNCIKKSGLKKTDIKEVILSGGSTRIPKIQELISQYFDGKDLNKFVNPDECVAEGAAIQAALFSKHLKQRIDEIHITDVCALSLGISNFVDLMTFVIDRNTPIPVSKIVTRRTIENRQSSMGLDVYEGERLNCKKNHYLGTVTVTDLTPAPPGQCEVLVTMSFDCNGILKVSAKEKYRNNVKDLTIVYTRGHRSDKEIESALKDAEDNKIEDEKFRKFANLKEYVLDYCERVIYNLEKKELVERYTDVFNLCLSTRKRADCLDQRSELKLVDLLDTVVEKCKDIVSRHSFEIMPTRT